MAYPPWGSFDARDPTAGWESEAWPYAVMAAMALIAVGMLVRCLGERGRSVIARPRRDPAPTGQTALTRRTWLILLLPVAYAPVMAQLGFLLASPLFIAAYLAVLGNRHWPTVAATALGLTVLAALAAAGLSDSPLPMGAGPVADFGNALIWFAR